MKAIRYVASVIATGLLLLVGGCQSTHEYSVNPGEYSGVRLYQVYCSSCHGLTGRGDGPVEPLIKGGVPDLTKIAARRQGQFPRDEIAAIIDGRKAFLAHGTANMPVWGFEFHSAMSDDALARRRSERMIQRLTSYVESLQSGNR